MWLVGANDVTAPQIERSLADTLALLDAHLATRPYLFGARPMFAGFGRWGRICQCGRDPTAGAMVAGVPNVVAWVERMLNPANLGEFESWPALAASLLPLLHDQVAALFLP